MHCALQHNSRTHHSYLIELIDMPMPEMNEVRHRSRFLPRPCNITNRKNVKEWGRGRMLYVSIHLHQWRDIDVIQPDTRLSR